MFRIGNASITRRLFTKILLSLPRRDQCTPLRLHLGAKDVVLSVISGINSRVFAYGQTSNGKTYTMIGITEYALPDIYGYIQKHQERDFVFKFSAMEIYNESVRDLLSVDNTPLRLLDDTEKGTVVEMLTEEILRDWSHVIHLFCICEAQRQIGETSLNEMSSRSHQIIRLTIESCSREFLGRDNAGTLTAAVNFAQFSSKSPDIYSNFVFQAAVPKAINSFKQ
ncbi:hypothetical protein ABFS82_01G106600 [Erythranthe guttata]